MVYGNVRGPIRLGHGTKCLWHGSIQRQIFATKPYICGSSYFLKMMDFKKGEWCNVMDGLYWNFINKNRKFFKEPQTFHDGKNF